MIRILLRLVHADQNPTPNFFHPPNNDVEFKAALSAGRKKKPPAAKCDASAPSPAGDSGAANGLAHVNGDGGVAPPGDPPLVAGGAQVDKGGETQQQADTNALHSTNGMGREHASPVKEMSVDLGHGDLPLPLFPHAFPYLSPSSSPSPSPSPFPKHVSPKLHTTHSLVPLHARILHHTSAHHAGRSPPLPPSRHPHGQDAQAQVAPAVWRDYKGPV